ncbi:hypothetical protein MalM25_30120 [Planctomycetes bacterium MalM25]|nr:hypothetical protein MalM25_30120 [Planctomycetes bacterium MalM25]
MTRSALFVFAAVLSLCPAVALAVNPAVWTLDETIDRNDGSVFWTSPSAVDLGFDRYVYDYEITKISASTFLSTIDVTDLVGESFDLIGGGETSELPVVLIDAPLDDPTTGTSADVLIEVDENGFGQGAFTNVMLGSVNFGITLNIESIRVEATVSLSGFNFQPGDYDQNGVVDPDDYGVWNATYGSTSDLRADGAEDGVVNAADYTVWRDAFNSPNDAAATPEPAGLAVGLLGVLAAAIRDRR